MNEFFNKNIKEKIPNELPVIPTIDVVVFPHMIVPLLVLDEKIIKGINLSLEKSKLILLLAAQKQIKSNSAVGTSDLYKIGTVASIMRVIKLPDGGIKVLVQGICKASTTKIFSKDDYLKAQIKKIDMQAPESEDVLHEQINNIKQLTEKMVTTGQTFNPDFHMILSKMENPEKIADFILSHLNLSVEKAQKLLEINSLDIFLSHIYQELQNELTASEVKSQVENDARASMNQSQQEFYLREQLRIIKKKLGEDDAEDIDELRKKLDTLLMPKETKSEVMRHLSRLERTAPESMEASITRTHLEWILSLPWGTETEDNLSIEHAKKILDEDHHGLKSIKDRILDFISIRNLKKDGHTPILCFVGPPGTGKTSLGKSIARSLNRKYGRISLGGVKDEAEIRGHRRTYVGAMPGRFIQALRKTESSNPVIIIDELDKIGSDFRGDPSAAMLELLDPHQNQSFHDNYLGVPFDLSKIIFIATANSLETLSTPLRDRMEIIELSGYTQEEKTSIAKKHLVSRSLKETGLEERNISFSDEILDHIASSYTRESGVRNYERCIRKVCSKIARSFVETGKPVELSIDLIDKYLGPKKFSDDEAVKNNMVGITNGLAWTIYGGAMIKIEAILIPGKGKLILTGQLGSVMQESAQAAMSYARAHAKEFNIDGSVFEKNDLHIHVPAGAIPKDGPSAGITILTSILSALTNRLINSNYAMTGELNLCGEVMPIGGVKEKILAAKRNNIKNILLPYKNKSDIVGIEEITNGIEVFWAEHANQVLERALLPAETPTEEKDIIKHEPATTEPIREGSIA